MRAWYVFHLFSIYYFEIRCTSLTKSTPSSASPVRSAALSLRSLLLPDTSLLNSAEQTRFQRPLILSHTRWWRWRAAQHSRAQTATLRCSSQRNCSLWARISRTEPPPWQGRFGGAAPRSSFRTAPGSTCTGRCCAGSTLTGWTSEWSIRCRLSRGVWGLTAGRTRSNLRLWGTGSAWRSTSESAVGDCAATRGRPVCTATPRPLREGWVSAVRQTRVWTSRCADSSRTSQHVLASVASVRSGRQPALPPWAEPSAAAGGRDFARSGSRLAFTARRSCGRTGDYWKLRWWRWLPPGEWLRSSCVWFSALILTWRGRREQQ